MKFTQFFDKYIKEVDVLVEIGAMNAFLEDQNSRRDNMSGIFVWPDYGSYDGFAVFTGNLELELDSSENFDFPIQYFIGTNIVSAIEYKNYLHVQKSKLGGIL